MNQRLKRKGLIGFTALAALIFTLPAHAQDDDEIKKNNAKGDTLTFNVSDFVLPEGANLDRLLRKLPGVTYYSSGSVEFDGITIKEMTVETKTFFKNAISSITSRIPAYAIQYVKFYDYDQGKRMSIKLKKEYKKKWWAEFSAALGPDNRYSEKVFAMIDDKKLRMTVYGNVNDINDSRQPGQETEWTGITVMKLNRYGYLIGEGFRNIFTHGFMSFASVTIIIACLIVMGSFTLLDININEIIEDIGDQNQILAYVDEDMTAQEATAQIQTKLEAIDNVASVNFVSRSEARKTFLEKYDESYMEGLSDEVFRHRFVIQLVDLSQMDATTAAIEGVSGIVKVNAPTAFANKFISVRNVVSVVSLVLIAILGFVSLFIMSNTIKLATYGRREEIAIMKMVGASNSFIRCPFVVEGLILGIVGGGLAFLAQWGLYKALEAKVAQSLAISFIQIVPFTQVWAVVLAAFLAVGILVGAVGGVIAIRNYLKV